MMKSSLLIVSVVIIQFTSEVVKDVSMNNYQKATVKEILKSVKILCIKCGGKMIRHVTLDDNTLIGYTCQDCPHYNLLNDNPV